jgi:hypothetical protein
MLATISQLPHSRATPNMSAIRRCTSPRNDISANENDMSAEGGSLDEGRRAAKHGRGAHTPDAMILITHLRPSLCFVQRVSAAVLRARSPGTRTRYLSSLQFRSRADDFIGLGDVSGNPRAATSLPRWRCVTRPPNRRRRHAVT